MRATYVPVRWPPTPLSTFHAVDDPANQYRRLRIPASDAPHAYPESTSPLARSRLIGFSFTLDLKTSLILFVTLRRKIQSGKQGSLR